MVLVVLLSLAHPRVFHASVDHGATVAEVAGVAGVVDREGESVGDEQVQSGDSPYGVSAQPMR